jgi:hypothetical protein
VMVTSVPWQLDSSSTAKDRVMARPDGPAAPARHKTAVNARPDAADPAPSEAAAPATPAARD